MTPMSGYNAAPKSDGEKQLTYLVTGSAGYIGSNVVKGLLARGIKRVYGICLPNDPLQLKEKRNFHSIELDILDAKLPEVLAEVQPDVIIHAVGAERFAPLKDQLTVYVEGTRHLLQSIVDAKSHARVVLLGSASEYGTYPKPVDESAIPKPTTEYGVSKYSQTLVAQLYAQKYHVPVIIARIFNPYGESPQDFVIASLASQLAQAEREKETRDPEITEPFIPQIHINNLQCFRDFIHVQDVVSGILALAERGYPGEIYNLASGNSIPLRLVLEGLLNYSQLNKQQLELKHAPQQDTDFSQGVIQKIIAHTGWRPQITLEQGLRDELAYWRRKTDAPVLGRV